MGPVRSPRSSRPELWPFGAPRPAGEAGCLEPAASAEYPLRRRLFDLVGAMLLLALASPLLVLIAVLVRLDSPGGAIFRQARVGRRGRPFELLKFRTMAAGADEGAHRRHVARLLGEGQGEPWAGLTPDDRVTRVGGWLRRTNLDELPQLVNVVRGEMSLVGPRPALPYETEAWRDWHFGRLAVPPGLTGAWQAGSRGTADFDEMVRLDLEYIGGRSLWRDLLVLARTPGALFRRSG